MQRSSTHRAQLAVMPSQQRFRWRLIMSQLTALALALFLFVGVSRYAGVRGCSIRSILVLCCERVCFYIWRRQPMGNPFKFPEASAVHQRTQLDDSYNYSAAWIPNDSFYLFRCSLVAPAFDSSRHPGCVKSANRRTASTCPGSKLTRPGRRRRRSPRTAGARPRLVRVRTQT